MKYYYNIYDNLDGSSYRLSVLKSNNFTNAKKEFNQLLNKIKHKLPFWASVVIVGCSGANEFTKTQIIKKYITKYSRYSSIKNLKPYVLEGGELVHNVERGFLIDQQVKFLLNNYYMVVNSYINK